MPRATLQTPSHSPPIKAACLSCRAAKIRCDGKNPCSRCVWKEVTCSYRPSRRGGIRRNPVSPKDNVRTAPNQPSPLFHLVDPVPQQRLLIHDQTIENGDTSSAHRGLEDVYDLLTPLGGVRNLDIPSDIGTERSSTDELLLPIPSEYGGFESTRIRLYTSDQDIVNAYYVYIHSYLPILHPQNLELYDDRPIIFDAQNSDVAFIDRSSLPYWPRSSLTLAISAILALIPLSEDDNAFSNRAIQTRRAHAHLFAEAAFGQVDHEIDGISAICSQPRSRTDGTDIHMQSRLDPILALVMLSVYEYCQRGNVSRMRSRANQALTTAMDLSLHNLGAKATEAQRRTWWSTMLVVYLSSIDQQTSPIINLTDPRITTPFPSLCDSSQVWLLLLEAEQSIITVSEVSKQYRMNLESGNLPLNASAKIMEVHSQLSDLIKRLDRLPEFTSRAWPEEKAAKNIWIVARLLVHSARIRLHRARAFRDIPMFLEKYCDLAAIQDKRETMPELDFASLQDLDSVFPFTEQQSSLMCFKSSLVISRALETLPLHHQPLKYPYPGHLMPYMLPFFVCAAMQSSYVLLTSHYRVRAALESGNLSVYNYLLICPEPDSEAQDAERFLREVRQAMESIIGAMKFAQMFEGVGGMSHEIRLAYQAAILTN